MAKFFISFSGLVLLIIQLCGCGTTRTTTTTAGTVDVQTVDSVAEGVAIVARDSSSKVSAVSAFDSLQISERTVSETFDSTGTLRQRTTTERTITRHHHTAQRDTATTGRAITIADSATAATHTTLHSDTTATTIAAREGANANPLKGFRIRFRWLFFGIVVAFAFVLWVKYQRISKSDYWT